VSDPDGASITVYPDGPLVVQGEFQLRSADGSPIGTDRTTLALCRCGRSRLKPLCDGSHKQARFAHHADADEMSYVLATGRQPRDASR